MDRPTPPGPPILPCPSDDLLATTIVTVTFTTQKNCAGVLYCSKVQ